MKYIYKKSVILFFIFIYISNFSMEKLKEIDTIDTINKTFLEENSLKSLKTNSENEETESLSSNSDTSSQEDDETNSQSVEKNENPNVVINTLNFKNHTSTKNDEKNDLNDNNLEKKRSFKEEINERTNRVTALGSAMGAIDLGSTPAKKLRLGAGVGNSSSNQAIGVGLGYAPTENFKVNTKFSTSTESLKNNSISVGASYDLDI